MSFDLSEVVNSMRQAASAVLQQDIGQLQGFAEQQLQAIAKQAQTLAQGIISGQVTEATRDFFLQGLQDMTSNFVRTLQGLSAVLAEKVWNAMVGELWSAISRATGLVLAVPTAAAL